MTAKDNQEQKGIPLYQEIDRLKAENKVLRKKVALLNDLIFTYARHLGGYADQGMITEMKKIGRYHEKAR